MSSHHDSIIFGYSESLEFLRKTQTICIADKNLHSSYYLYMISYPVFFWIIFRLFKNKQKKKLFEKYSLPKISSKRLCSNQKMNYRMIMRNRSNNDNSFDEIWIWILTSNNIIAIARIYLKYNLILGLYHSMISFWCRHLLAKSVDEGKSYQL